MRDCFAPNFSSFGRVKVEDSEHMWDVVKACERHHISMEHRLRRKQLNSDTNASNKTYLKEIQEKKTRSVEFNCVFQPCTSRFYSVLLFLRRTMSTQHWSRVMVQANTSGKQSKVRIAGGNRDTVTY